MCEYSSSHICEPKVKIERKMLMVGWSQCEGLITVQFMSENVLVVDDKALAESSD